MSRKSAWVVLVLLAVSFGFGVRTINAGPTHETWDTYYNCALVENGWRDQSCSGAIYSGGTLAGAYRFREYYDCETYQSTYQWYYWNGSSWTAFSGPPGPNC